MKIDYLAPRFNDDIVLSILKEHSDRIFSGAKKYELRKVVPKSVPRRVFVYESEGSKSIVGYFVVDRIICAPPSMLWEEVAQRATTRQRFFNYFSGRSVGYAYEIAIAVRYPKAIPLADLQKIDTSLIVPQSFQYLDFYSPVRRMLLEYAGNVAISGMSDGELIFQKIDPKYVPKFVELVDKHITGSYQETGSTYAKKILEISDTGQDTEGVITQSKTVLQILKADQLAGFVVVTEKAGGALKTGPTLLIDEYQHLGLGKVLRVKLHEFALKLGYRKVYCTFPETKIEYSKYLFRSGYRLEAHLRKHYHPDHDELVFGFNLSPYRFRIDPQQRSFAEVVDVRRVENTDQEVVQFLVEEFPKEVCPIPEGWAEKQVRIAAASTKKAAANLPFKPRWIFVGRGIAVEIVCLVIFKRGGSAKLILVSATSNPVGLKKMIESVERSVLRSKFSVRKVYTHIRAGDSAVFDAFTSSGYAPEGLLDRPYTDWQDTVVVGKLVGK